VTKIAGSGSASGSISQRHGSADPDPGPDPHQNVMDPQHCSRVSEIFSKMVTNEARKSACGNDKRNSTDTTVSKSLPISQVPYLSTVSICFHLGEKCD
jgi:hypothetical protein